MCARKFVSLAIWLKFYFSTFHSGDSNRLQANRNATVVYVCGVHMTAALFASKSVLNSNGIVSTHMDAKNRRGKIGEREIVNNQSEVVVGVAHTLDFWILPFGMAYVTDASWVRHMKYIQEVIHHRIWTLNYFFSLNSAMWKPNEKNSEKFNTSALCWRTTCADIRILHPVNVARVMRAWTP